MAGPGFCRHRQYGNHVVADVRSATANWFSFGWLAPTVALANAVVLVAAVRYLNPSTLSFLTEEIDQVAPFIRLALLVSLIGNIVRLWFSPSWFVGLADVLATLAGLMATVRLFQIFPFSFNDAASLWTMVLRVLLIMAMVGAAFGIVLSAGRLLAMRGAVGGRSENGPDQRQSKRSKDPWTR